jgi:hypothetical protein
MIFEFPIPVSAEQSNVEYPLIFSRGKSAEQWNENEKIIIENKGYYFTARHFILTSQQIPIKIPLDINIWGSGIETLDFFDPTPLFSAFHDVKDLISFKNLLLPSKFDGTELEELNKLIHQSTLLEQNQIYWKRTLAISQMNLFGIETIKGLWEILKKQTTLGNKIIASNTFSVSDLTLTWGSILSYQGKTTITTMDFFNEFKKKSLIKSILNLKLYSKVHPRIILYFIRIPDKSTDKHLAKIFFSGLNQKTESFPITLKVPLDQSILKSWPIFLNAMFSPMVTALVGGALGLMGGYFIFRIQQNYLIKKEEEKDFFQGKKINSKKISEFFKGEDYITVLKDSGIQEIQKAKLIRELLIIEEIYAILPSKELEYLNKICDPNKFFIYERSEKLKTFFKKNFREFIEI